MKRSCQQCGIACMVMVLSATLVGFRGCVGRERVRNDWGSRLSDGVGAWYVERVDVGEEVHEVLDVSIIVCVGAPKETLRDAGSIMPGGWLEDDDVFGCSVRFRDGVVIGVLYGKKALWKWGESGPVAVEETTSADIELVTGEKWKELSVEELAEALFGEAYVKARSETVSRAILEGDSPTTRPDGHDDP